MDAKWTDAGKVLALKSDFKAVGLNNVGSGAPSNPEEGEPWYDSTNHFIRWYDGTGWNAIAVYIGTAAPGTPVEGLLWYDTTNNLLKSYDGAAWVVYALHIGTAAPSVPTEGHLWYDTTNNLLKSYDGSAWVVYALHIGTAAPGAPTEGHLWYDTTNNLLKSYDGAAWHTHLTIENAIDVKLITEAVSSSTPGRLAFDRTGISMYSPESPVSTEILRISSKLRQSGSQTDVTADKLRDSGGGFTANASIGDYVINITDSTDAKITNVDSDIMVTLDTDIFGGTEEYEILVSTTGDIVIGKAGAYLSYDSSAGTLTFDGLLGAGIVDQSALKTDTEEESGFIVNDGQFDEFTFSSVGSYGFYPQVKFEANTTGSQVQIGAANSSTSYVTIIAISHTTGTGNKTCYAQIRYVTASGEICWLFILQDKVTQKYIRMHKCPDHPAISCHDPEAVHHPFYDNYDSKKHNIFCIPITKAERAEVEDLREWKNELPGLSFLETVKKYYAIDENPKDAKWPTIPVTIGLDRKKKPMKAKIPKRDYIKQAALIKKI